MLLNTSTLDPKFVRDGALRQNQYVGWEGGAAFRVTKATFGMSKSSNRPQIEVELTLEDPYATQKDIKAVIMDHLGLDTTPKGEARSAPISKLLQLIASSNAPSWVGVNDVNAAMVALNGKDTADIARSLENSVVYASLRTEVQKMDADSEPFVQSRVQAYLTKTVVDDAAGKNSLRSNELSAAQVLAQPAKYPPKVQKKDGAGAQNARAGLPGANQAATVMQGGRSPAANSSPFAAR